jgi:hypothetical protein
MAKVSYIIEKIAKLVVVQLDVTHVHEENRVLCTSCMLDRCKKFSHCPRCHTGLGDIACHRVRLP